MIDENRYAPILMVTTMSEVVEMHDSEIHIRICNRRETKLHNLKVYSPFDPEYAIDEYSTF